MKLEYVEGFSYDPAVDAGKVLKVKEDGTGLEWAEGSGEGSGGGGGGSSPFEQMLGITGYAEVTVNFTLPEGEIPANGEVNVQMTIYNSLDSATWNTNIQTYIATDTISVVIQIPLSSNHVTIFTIEDVDNINNSYIVDQYTSLSGDVEFHQDDVFPAGVIVVNGDGVVNATMIIA